MSTVEAKRERDLWSRRISRAMTLFLRWFSGHWLVLLNLLAALYVLLPFLAPILMEAGRDRAAGLIYTLYRPLCHQLPERSYFLFGRQPVYLYPELSHLLEGVVPPRFVGSPEIGYKVAVCQRCVAFYGMIPLAGAIFGFLRRSLSPLSLKGFALLLAPMAVDGMGQLLGFWTSTWLTRLITGALSGGALVWLVYPYAQRAMRELYRDMSRATEERT